MSHPLFAEYSPRPPESSRQERARDFTARPGGMADVAAIAMLSAERSGRAIAPIVESVDRQMREDLERNDLTLVAEVGNKIVGFGRARWVSAADNRPPGWYLLGVIVGPGYRRRGIAAELVRQRLAWIAGRSHEAHYFVNSLNLASIDLHRAFGFVEIQRPFCFPSVEFSGGGVGVLFRTDRLPTGAAPASIIRCP